MFLELSLKATRCNFYDTILVDADQKKGNSAATLNMVIHLRSEDNQQMRSKANVTGSYSSGEISQGWSQSPPHC